MANSFYERTERFIKGEGLARDASEADVVCRFIGYKFPARKMQEDEYSQWLEDIFANNRWVTQRLLYPVWGYGQIWRHAMHKTQNPQLKTVFDGCPMPSISGAMTQDLIKVRFLSWKERPYLSDEIDRLSLLRFYEMLTDQKLLNTFTKPANKTIAQYRERLTAWCVPQDKQDILLRSFSDEINENLRTSGSTDSAAPLKPGGATVVSRISTVSTVQHGQSLSQTYVDVRDPNAFVSISQGQAGYAVSVSHTS